MVNLEDIVNRNVNFLKTEGKKVLFRESFGGNAGYHNGNPCAGLNFYFDKHTGEITYVGNDPFTNGIFRVELTNGQFYILDAYIRSNNKNGITYINFHDSNLSNEVKEVLAMTIRKYNITQSCNNQISQGHPF